MGFGLVAWIDATRHHSPPNLQTTKPNHQMEAELFKAPQKKGVDSTKESAPQNRSPPSILEFHLGVHRFLVCLSSSWYRPFDDGFTGKPKGKQCMLEGSYKRTDPFWVWLPF